MRRRLVLVSLAVTSMVALAFLIPLALLVRNVARDRAMDAAESDAVAMAVSLAVTRETDALAEALARTDAGVDGRMTLYLPGGGTVGRPHERDPEVDLAIQTGRAFTISRDGGSELYQPVIVEEGTVVVEVFVPDAELSRGVARAWGALGVVAVVLIAVGVAAADRLARSVVAPTRRLADAAVSLGTGDLDVRVDPTGPPELVDVGHAFNTLAGRVRELVAYERERIADLSHRLRTPLTALRLDADALGDEEPARRVQSDADELERVVDGLIHEARRPVATELGTSDLAARVRERVEFWSALAEDQGRSMTSDVALDSAAVRGRATDLDAALDALIGNVIDHTPEQTALHVALAAHEDEIVVTVDDAGPGFADVDAALTRGESGGGSTGLGLDIARRAVDLAGGTIELGRADLGGARVTLRFPRA